MLEIKNVINIDISEIKSRTFDLAIFASGYEQRSSHLARFINKSLVENYMILGFSEHNKNEIRKDNDNFYTNNYSEPIVLSSSDEKEIYKELNKFFKKLSHKSSMSILIDYTSMSRLWYAGILNFIKFQTNLEVEVYLNYSVGQYNDNIYSYTYKSINSLPSHEGSLCSNTRTILILSVGFYPELAQSVIEEIEPNDIIGVLSIPSLKQDYEERSLKSKKYLEQDIYKWINCPINDLENIFRTYAEIASNNISEKDVLFLSLGPKIFTLASILVSQRFEQVTCLYLKSEYNDLNNVYATGDYICNKIIYK